MSALAFWRENFRRTLRAFEKPQMIVGLLAVLVTAFGFSYIIDNPHVVRWTALAGVVYLLVLLCAVTPQRMWNDSQRQVRRYEALSKPKLRIVFLGDPVPPYLQEQLLPADDGATYIDRRIRVGVLNESSRAIRNVRVVLESFEQVVEGKLSPPTAQHPVLLEHALNVMGLDNKTGLVNVAPGDRPTAFFDVAAQPMFDDNRDWFSPCYASRHRVSIFAGSTFVLCLRVEGGGTFDRARFVVGATLGDRRIRMAPYQPGPLGFPSGT